MKFKILENEIKIKNIEKMICYDTETGDRIYPLIKERMELLVDEYLGLGWQEQDNNISISEEGKVSCNWVMYEDKWYKYLPLQFEYVKSIEIIDCRNLISLQGSPKFVNGSVDIEGCKNLTALKGGPEYVMKSYSVDSNSLTSLEGSPKYVGTFYGFMKNKITSLKGITPHIGDSVYADQNTITDISDIKEFKELTISSLTLVDIRTIPYHKKYNQNLSVENENFRINQINYWYGYY